MGTYVDTSALVKRYVHEPSSMAFDDFIAASDDEFVISPLTLVELQSVLMRRLRQDDFDRAYLRRLRGHFDSDLRAALWVVMPFPVDAFAAAMRLIEELDVAVATLDALHVASAKALGCTRFATADRQQARAAERCGLSIHDFSS
ncbi:MAG: type II toxin-antitoxin system VapC family toxin [Burkholderiaceae bacterium]|nr:type II toxin-antitoxin system VapC family toxin [Burkholderiaceae bacterium]